MLDCMKRQLTECRGWNNKNFGFGTILCSFFFLREYPVSVHERQCEGMRPHSQQCVDGQHCCRDRGEEGP
jgi:hypothetical protein